MSIGRVPCRLAKTDTGRRALPVRAEVLQQARGERRGAILGALALLDPDGHTVGVDVRHPERDGFADAQAGGVDGGQQQPMARMLGRGQQPPHLFPTQDLRQFLRLHVLQDSFCSRIKWARYAWTLSFVS